MLGELSGHGGALRRAREGANMKAFRYVGPEETRPRAPGCVAMTGGVLTRASVVLLVAFALLNTVDQESMSSGHKRQTLRNTLKRYDRR